MLVFILGLSSCIQKKDKLLPKIVEDYYNVYNERQDIDQFMQFYAKEVVLEDIINGDRIEGKQALKSFFNWDDPNFKKLSPNNLIITDKLIDENKVVLKGYFMPFKWGEAEFNAMHFTSILSFNSSGKIIHQTDWINYPSSLVNYNERKNANEWIK